MWSWGLNLGLQACIASILPTEPSHQPFPFSPSSLLPSLLSFPTPRLSPSLYTELRQESLSENISAWIPRLLSGSSCLELLHPMDSLVHLPIFFWCFSSELQPMIPSATHPPASWLFHIWPKLHPWVAAPRLAVYLLLRDIVSPLIYPDIFCFPLLSASECVHSRVYDP